MGFEPMTSSAQGWRATSLRYTPMRPALHGLPVQETRERSKPRKTRQRQSARIADTRNARIVERDHRGLRDTGGTGIRSASRIMRPALRGLACLVPYLASCGVL